MIVITGQNEESLIGQLESVLKDEEVSMYIADDEAFTLEQLASMGVFNLQKTRQYVGRLERNTRKIDESIKDVGSMLEPVTLFFQILLDEYDSENEEDSSVVATKLRRHLSQHKRTKQRLINKGLIKEQS